MAPASRTSVLVVVGTRPEAIKLVPIILALRESETLRPIVVSTGQHHTMVQDVFGLAGITVDAELWAAGHGRLNELVAAVMRRFEDFCSASFGDHGTNGADRDEVLSGHYPAAVLVHGDTSSAFATAMAAFHLRIPVVHVEAGLRTHGFNFSPFPEELNRELISRIAAFHLAPTVTCAQNLVRETVPAGQVFVTGNTGIDALQWAVGLGVDYADPAVAAAANGDGRIVVVTAHRRENWSGGLAQIAEAVRRLASSHADTTFVVPLHPNPLVRHEVGVPLEGLPNVLLPEPLSYASFARLLGRAHLVITDSGGIQEEAPSLGTPVVVTRDITERLEGVEAGTLALAGTEPDTIVALASRLLDDEAAHAEMAAAINPYGDGHAAARIVAALEHLQGAGDPPAPFGPGYRRDLVLEAAGYEEGLRPWLRGSGQRGVPEPAPPDQPMTWHR
ncbi:MAG: UDP-N-acetylglucosamine 2-epimerase (non-hydrolyzing) [Solirubrobacteraceae bacterium]